MFPRGSSVLYHKNKECCETFFDAPVFSNVQAGTKIVFCSVWEENALSVLTWHFKVLTGCRTYFELKGKLTDYEVFKTGIKYWRSRWHEQKMIKWIKNGTIKLVNLWTKNQHLDGRMNNFFVQLVLPSVQANRLFIIIENQTWWINSWIA